GSLVVFKDYFWTMHYLHPMFLFPLFAWPVFLSWKRALRSADRIAIWVTTSVCLIVPLFILARAPRPQVDLRAYRPPLVRDLDAIANDFNLKYGYAGYWQARLITLLSTKGLRAYQVLSNLTPFEWENNVEWYQKSVEDRAKPPLITFVVLKDPAWSIPKENVLAILGQPAREVSVDASPILIYGGVRGPLSYATNQPLRLFQQEITSPQTRLEIRAKEIIQLPVRVRNPSAETWSSIGRAPVTLSYKWFEGPRILPIEG